MRTISLFLSFSIAFWMNVGHGQDQAHQCFVTFEILNAGFKTTGKLNATILENTFKTAPIEKSSVVIVAEPATITTGIEIRDKHLQRADYFDTAHFPQIILKSKHFKKLSRNKFVGEFQLTVKGKKKDIHIPFTMRRMENLLFYEGVFQIQRSEFDIGGSSMTLADEVVVRFKVVESDLIDLR